ncbi:DeoR family transcriptional regulator, partial [Pantoea ananatis]
MLTTQRKQLILEKLEAEGQVQSKALSTLFAVSEDTIRRDLRELAA